MIFTYKLIDDSEKNEANHHKIWNPSWILIRVDSHLNEHRVVSALKFRKKEDYINPHFY